MKDRKILKYASAVLLSSSVFCVSSLQAATITWSVHDITNDVSQISTNGVLMEARGGGSSPVGGVVVNGVTFVQTNIVDTTYHDNIGSLRVGGITGAYGTLLQYTDRVRTSAYPIPVSFTNLNAGSQYEIQIWSSDTGENFLEKGVILNDGGIVNVPDLDTSGHVKLWQEVTDGGPGQYAIGTFTADASIQQFLAVKYNFSGGIPTTQADHLQLNAVQLRLTFTPPSGTVLIIK